MILEGSVSSSRPKFRRDTRQKRMVTSACFTCLACALAYVNVSAIQPTDILFSSTVSSTVAAMGASDDPIIFYTVGLQRSGTNMLRGYLNSTTGAIPFNVTEHSPRGSAAREFCYPCLRQDRPAKRCQFQGVVAARNSPASVHFLVQNTTYSPSDQDRAKCGMHRIDYSIQSAQDLDALFGISLYYTVIVKEPISWLISVTDFWKINCWNMPENCYKVLELWDTYYGKWIEISKASPDKVIITRYEDLLLSHETALKRASKFLRTSFQSAANVTSMRIHLSEKHDFHAQVEKYTSRYYLQASNYPSFNKSDPGLWLRKNCHGLRRFFRTYPKTVGELDYDLQYLDDCVEHYSAVS